MLKIEKHKLDNELRLIVHYDPSTPMVAVNLLYCVGSRNEDPARTGFAHLFEHLMFGGSENVPDYDLHMQLAGGENNAFTNSDVTNYYAIVPANNLETVLWLESDRMKNLIFSQESLDVQKRVVIEEFKETSLNQPYGDVWHHLSALAYKKHPYRWPTIGKNPKHIEFAELRDVNSFFSKYYHPGNAVISLAGNIHPQKAVSLVEKWFSDIPPAPPGFGVIEVEPAQKRYSKKVVRANVPASAIYMAFHMPGRNDPGYYVCDIISDILSNGRSSRLYQELYKEKKIFSEVDAFITGSVDPGLFIIEGRINPESDSAKAEEAVWDELRRLNREKVREEELRKVKNKIENSLVFSEVNVLNKAISLAFFEWLGDAELINRQSGLYESVSRNDIQQCAKTLFKKKNCSVIVYEPEN